MFHESVIIQKEHLLLGVVRPLEEVFYRPASRCVVKRQISVCHIQDLSIDAVKEFFCKVCFAYAWFSVEHKASAGHFGVMGSLEIFSDVMNVDLVDSGKRRVFKDILELFFLFFMQDFYVLGAGQGLLLHVFHKKVNGALFY